LSIPTQQPTYEEDFQQSGGGWWIHKIGIIVYVAVILAFAIQTLELVNWLFPADNQFMKIVTVFVADGCATGWAMAEMFYRFRLRRSKHLAFGMWIVTFILSTAATVIQMYLSSTGNIPHKIDPSVITIAYGVVILAFVINIIAITVIIRMEYVAGQPQHVYLDDKPRVKRPLPIAQPVQVTQVPATAAQTDQLSPADVQWLTKLIAERQEQDKPILEERAGQESHTRRFGGDPQLEREEDLNPS
jgi:hypothetical protein